MVVGVAHILGADVGKMRRRTREEGVVAAAKRGQLCER